MDQSAEDRLRKISLKRKIRSDKKNYEYERAYGTCS